MKDKIKKIALLTSGGDAPGMNACIRAVVRAGIYYNLEVFGIKRGYQGLIENDIHLMSSRSVSNIIQRGGTILKSARSKDFMIESGMNAAYQNLKKNNIDSLIVIGGDGTFTGANIFSNKFDIPIIGIPGTIDNDLNGTDATIGFDTATNTALDAIDKIRDTANSHNRLFFIEVMGRDSGYIAVKTGISGGAEAILIPEKKTTINELIAILDRGSKQKKSSSLVVIAEGGESGGVIDLAKKVEEKFSYYDTRVTILGHLQRGGTPTCTDRVLASLLGVRAVEGLIEGKSNMMVGTINKKVVFTPFEKALKKKKTIDRELIRISKILSNN